MLIVKENPNKEYADSVREALKLNNMFCPCSMVCNDDTECMCKKFREQDYEGYCHCELYYKISSEG